MKKNIFISLLFSTILFISAMHGQNKPSFKQIIKKMETANEYYMNKYPNPADSIKTPKKTYPSNIWTRAVYFEGLFALYEVKPEERYIEYIRHWGEGNKWNFRGGLLTRNADNMCCGQTYIDFYRSIKEPKDNYKIIIQNSLRLLNNVVNSSIQNDWTWIDAIQMAMPLFAKIGTETGDMRYFTTLMDMYEFTRNKIERIGLFNPVEGLWWRDADFLPPYKEPNGANCYWSRGNGWVYAAIVRTIDEINKAYPSVNEEDRKTLTEFKNKLISDYVIMSMKIASLQRTDGFWNCSLLDENHYGGKESSGTALFLYGMTWGVRNNILSEEKFAPVIIKSWKALSEDALHDNGFIGYVQSTGKEPKDGQPVTYDKTPDFEDFGLGCFLLAGSEMAKWSKQK